MEKNNLLFYNKKTFLIRKIKYFINLLKIKFKKHHENCSYNQLKEIQKELKIKTLRR